MTIDTNRIAECRELVLRILSGEMSSETHRALFEEDAVYFAIRALEEHDTAWLLSQVRNRDYPFSGRCELVSWGMGRYQKEMWAELQCEDPTLPPLFPE